MKIRFVQQGIEEILDTYRATVATEPFGEGNRLAWLFEAVQALLKEKLPIKSRTKLVVEKFIGEEHWGRVPGFVFYDESETNSYRQGVYVYLLLNEEMTGAYLTLNQGIRSVIDNKGILQGREVLAATAAKLRNYCVDLTSFGFKVDGEVQVSRDVSFAKDYAASTVAYKFYEKNQVPIDLQILKDLDAVLRCYDQYLEDKSHTSAAPKEVAVAAAKQQKSVAESSQARLVSNAQSVSDPVPHTQQVHTQTPANPVQGLAVPDKVDHKPVMPVEPEPQQTASRKQIPANRLDQFPDLEKSTGYDAAQTPTAFLDQNPVVPGPTSADAETLSSGKQESMSVPTSTPASALTSPASPASPPASPTAAPAYESEAFSNDVASQGQKESSMETEVTPNASTGSDDVYQVSPIVRAAEHQVNPPKVDGVWDAVQDAVEMPELVLQQPMRVEEPSAVPSVSVESQASVEPHDIQDQRAQHQDAQYHDAQHQDTQAPQFAQQQVDNQQQDYLQGGVQHIGKPRFDDHGNSGQYEDQNQIEELQQDYTSYAGQFSQTQNSGPQTTEVSHWTNSVTESHASQEQTPVPLAQQVSVQEEQTPTPVVEPTHVEVAPAESLQKASIQQPSLTKEQTHDGRVQAQNEVPPVPTTEVQNAATIQASAVARHAPTELPWNDDTPVGEANPIAESILEITEKPTAAVAELTTELTTELTKEPLEKLSAEPALEPKNLILYGPPGTGKTFALTRIFLPQYQGRHALVTFHQSYSYEDFVEGIRPLNSEGNVKYEIKAGVFKEICQRAKLDPNNRYAVLIDEVNRGNVVKILGELITLIEFDKRAVYDASGTLVKGLEVTLPYSGEKFSVPKNVDIIATMNTADRSIALLDSALRRRFTFEEMIPDSSVIEGTNDGVISDGEGGEVDLRTLLNAINKRMRFLLHRDQTLGHAYFTEVKDLSTLKQVILRQIIPLLQEYFYDDWYKLQLVFKDVDSSGDKIEPQIICHAVVSEEDVLGSDYDDFDDQIEYWVSPEQDLTPAAIRKIYS